MHAHTRSALCNYLYATGRDYSGYPVYNISNTYGDLLKQSQSLS